MIDRMTRRERLDALQRSEPTDRPAWALWRHFYDKGSTAEDLAEAMVGWQRTYGFDFLKVNPRAQYYIEPWGARFRYPGDGQRPEQLSVPVRTIDDWKRIEPRPPTAAAFGEQLRAIRMIREALGPDVPIVETIFTPISVVGDLVASDQQLLDDLRTDPNAVEAALSAVTETLAGFAVLCVEAGADGIFFATTQWASHDLLTDEEYDRFGRPFDLQVLEAVAGAPFNVLHVCGDHSMLFELADYPHHAVNWAATSPAAPSLQEAAGRVPGLLVGGVSHDALMARSPEALLAEARAARAATDGQRWMLGPNCSIPVTTPDANLMALKEAILSGLMAEVED